MIQKPLTGLGSSLPATLVSIFFIQFLWFFGLWTDYCQFSNGPDWNTLMLDNLELYKAGESLPHIVTNHLWKRSLLVWVDRE